MPYLRIFVWSVVCFGLGIGAATIDIGNKTALEHAVAMLVGLPSHASRPAPRVHHPSERHTESEREAIDALIVKRQGRRD